MYHVMSRGDQRDDIFLSNLSFADQLLIKYAQREITVPKMQR
jgi:hypothetical protein